MKPHERMRVELLDEAGNAIAGAKVVPRGTTMRGTGDPLQAMLQGMRGQVAQLWTDLRTDGNGRIEIPFVPVDGVAQRLALEWDGGRSAEFVLATGEGWTTARPR